MRTTPEIQSKLKARLQDAVTRAGSADSLGRALGWTNGGYVRLVLSGKRNCTPEFIARANASPEAWLHGWFDASLGPLSKLDVLTREVVRAKDVSWPFSRLTLEMWRRLDAARQAIVEDAAITKARELLAELATAPAAASALTKPAPVVPTSKAFLRGGVRPPQPSLPETTPRTPATRNGQRPKTGAKTPRG